MDQKLKNNPRWNLTFQTLKSAFSDWAELEKTVHNESPEQKQLGDMRKLLEEIKDQVNTFNLWEASVHPGKAGSEMSAPPPARPDTPGESVPAAKEHGPENPQK